VGVEGTLYWVQISLGRGILNTTLCDKVCQWLAAGLWFSPGTPNSSTNKTDQHDIIEILLKVALNTITLNNTAAVLIMIKVWTQKLPQNLESVMIDIEKTIPLY
jgi:hypothetical protein